ncbi:family 16 glycosylhydrolase [Reyranella sp.]|uniref:family 16 glycosylhydrolase n=1 Tax=Reyranella sp. TaxID=1929291 RepID=UPI003C79A3DC
MNVYYNPGDDGAELNYGYRGTPVQIDLGFDASEDFHRYAIEWEPTGIKWFVDDKLIHERTSWDPTPIPHLPMQFFINLWSSRSEEFAGRLALEGGPAHSDIRSIRLQGHKRAGVS